MPIIKFSESCNDAPTSPDSSSYHQSRHSILKRKNTFSSSGSSRKQNEQNGNKEYCLNFDDRVPKSKRPSIFLEENAVTPQRMASKKQTFLSNMQSSINIELPSEATTGQDSSGNSKSPHDSISDKSQTNLVETPAASQKRRQSNSSTGQFLRDSSQEQRSFYFDSSGETTAENSPQSTLQSKFFVSKDPIKESRVKDNREQFLEGLLCQISVYRFLNRLIYKLQKYCFKDAPRKKTAPLFELLTKRKVAILWGIERQCNSAQHQFSSECGIALKVVQRYLTKEKGDQHSTHWTQRQQLHQSFLREVKNCGEFCLRELKRGFSELKSTEKLTIRSAQTLAFQIQLRHLKLLFFETTDLLGCRVNSSQHQSVARHISDIIETQQMDRKINFNELETEYRRLVDRIDKTRTGDKTEIMM